VFLQVEHMLPDVLVNFSDEIISAEMGLAQKSPIVKLDDSPADTKAWGSSPMGVPMLPDLWRQE